MRNTFVPGLFNTAWYNGKPFDYDEGFISNRENFLVGMPRLRQIRILPGNIRYQVESYFSIVILMVCSSIEIPNYIHVPVLGYYQKRMGVPGTV